MRSVSVRTRRGLALLILLVTVTVIPVFAEEVPPGTEAPQGRILPPVGVTSMEEAPQGRIAPPVGIASAEEPPQARIQIPVGIASEPPSVWELFIAWLQGRIQPPVG